MSEKPNFLPSELLDTTDFNTFCGGSCKQRDIEVFYGGGYISVPTRPGNRFFKRYKTVYMPACCKANMTGRDWDRVNSGLRRVTQW